MNLRPADTEKLTKWKRIIIPDERDLHKIDYYLATGGYKALKKAMEMKPDEVIDEVKKSTYAAAAGLVSRQD